MKKNAFQLALWGIGLLLATTTHAQYLYDSVFFETPTSKIVIENPKNNSWQIGQPMKTFFNAAHTGARAIITDTAASYPINDTSSFIYIIRNPYTQTCVTSLSFWHMYDMDTLTDVGIIEASYDGGKSWFIAKDTIIEYPDFSVFYWEEDYHADADTYSMHQTTITGKSDGWIQSRFKWQWWLPVKSDTILYPPDSLMVRFTLISDGIDSGREGWLIDDMLTSSAEGELCSGLDDHRAAKKVTISPNPFTTQATISADFDLSNATISIFNATGKQVQTIECQSNQPCVIQRNGLPAGIYSLVITSKNQWQISKKLLIAGED